MKDTEAARRWLRQAVASVIEAGAPRDLCQLANRINDEDSFEIVSEHLTGVLMESEPSDPFMSKFMSLVVTLDGAEDGQWTEGTVRYTSARRTVITRALGMDSAGAARLSEVLEVVKPEGPAIVYQEFSRWYTGSGISGHSFYWRHYERYLRLIRKWPEEAIRELGLATERIVGMLANPLEHQDRSRRGLVVGHVQSGKTANYTGVIARAIDAGYRLVIVLTGMQEPLRRQTQRRIDMELIGTRNILLDHTERTAIDVLEGEYLIDPDWAIGAFNDLGGEEPAPEIERLTSHGADFEKGAAGRLRFVSSSEIARLQDPEFLLGLRAKVAVVKKNQAVLGHLLKSMDANATVVKAVPTLIIDDESDQASVNTAVPPNRRRKSRQGSAHSVVGLNDGDESKIEEKKERKRINQQISKMLERMPRVQYVGYTATPFANVLIDPSDEADIFPRDFIVSLREPSGYMGASAFFDTNSSPNLGYTLTNKQARIRELKAIDSDEDGQAFELQGALAAFIVTGAIKLFRASRDQTLLSRYRHHTMLVHETQTKAGHSDQAQRIRELWSASGWKSHRGMTLLRREFDDLRPTLEDRRVSDVPVVDNFKLLEPFITEAVEKIETPFDDGGENDRNCVVVVNSDVDFQDRLDFERHDTWKVVVGGAMLSRGFTIEGLTVSYFRRLPGAHDTLLQMGRWFGYRPGYSDLVRLYLGTNVGKSRKNPVSLYDAFVAIAESEQEFRSQLEKYAVWGDDAPLVTPRDVPPLVMQSLPWLKPTAANKMYNAQIVTQREDVFTPKAMSPARSDVRANWNATLPLVKKANHSVPLAVGSRRFSAYLGLVDVSMLVNALQEVWWMDEYYERTVRPRLNYYERCLEAGTIKDFLIVMAQIGERSKYAPVRIEGLGERTAVERSRNASKGYYEEFTDPVHRQLALDFLAEKEETPTGLSDYRAGLTRGVILAYLIPEKGLLEPSSHEGPQKVSPEMCTLGLNIYLPLESGRGSTSGPKVFESIDSSKANREGR